MDNDDDNAANECHRARKLWFSAETKEDLDEVERIYRKVWERCAYAEAGERLATLCLQSGRPADDILLDLGYSCRLAVLNYSLNATQEDSSQLSTTDASMIPGRVWNDFLTPFQLQILRETFQNPQADYWQSHNYQVEPPSPYFSYVLPMDQLQDYGTLGEIVKRVQQQVAAWKPLVNQCTYVELWAHNRPHVTGHQLHFDSDNEGMDATIRNPLVSTILYLSSGGPSLFTNQRRSSRRLATQGWYSLAQTGRLVAFDGSILHGVLPGKGVGGGNRITIMLAFWKRIRVRPGDEPGAARPFPRDAPWAQTLLSPAIGTGHNQATEVAPCPVAPVYVQIKNRQPWQGGIPEYDQVFQGI